MTNDNRQASNDITETIAGTINPDQESKTTYSKSHLYLYYINQNYETTEEKIHNQTHD